MRRAAHIVVMFDAYGAHLANKPLNPLNCINRAHAKYPALVRFYLVNGILMYAKRKRKVNSTVEYPSTKVKVIRSKYSIDKKYL